MAYTKIDYRGIDPVNEGMHFLRDALGCDQLGVTVVECNPRWTGLEHDHGDEAHEEVYVLVEGEATVTVEGDEVDLTAGDVLRVDPDATRQIHNGDTESLFVLIGAP